MAFEVHFDRPFVPLLVQNQGFFKRTEPHRQLDQLASPLRKQTELAVQLRFNLARGQPLVPQFADAAELGESPEIVAQFVVGFRRNSLNHSFARPSPDGLFAQSKLTADFPDRVGGLDPLKAFGFGRFGKRDDDAHGTPRKRTLRFLSAPADGFLYIITGEINPPPTPGKIKCGVAWKEALAEMVCLEFTRGLMYKTANEYFAARTHRLYPGGSHSGPAHISV